MSQEDDDATIRILTELALEVGPKDIAGELIAYVGRLHRLVRWYDRAYGDNEPTWLFENQYGQPLTENVELLDTYRGIFGIKPGVSP